MKRFTKSSYQQVINILPLPKTQFNYTLLVLPEQEKKKEIYAAQKEIAWGSQIRTYTLHPYKLVKDHRTQVEISQVDAVLDGEIDTFIETYLLSQKKGN